MCLDSDSPTIRIQLAEADSVEELVLAFRKDGELHELAALEPPVEGILKDD